jgi:hypothetical protein
MPSQPESDGTPTPSRARSDVIQNLSVSIDDALELLREYRSSSKNVAPPKEIALVGLVEQCRAMCAKPDIVDEPIRTVHHFACTGGTVICKCVAAMPNTQVLSEIDPLSTMTTNTATPIFRPTDLIAQARQSARGTNEDTRIQMFLASLDVLSGSETRLGRRLVIRDHAHSQFCTNQDPSLRPTLLEILKKQHRTLSIVTVRDPVESYLSLQQRKWIHFTPQTFDEYCSRYLRFLRRHEGVPVFKYENFIENPSSTIQSICDVLKLPYQEQFENLFGVFKLTGDSGRGSDVIAPRAARPLDERISAEIAAADHYRELADELGYSCRTAT